MKRPIAVICVALLVSVTEESPGEREKVSTQLAPAPHLEAARGVSFDDISGSSGISRFQHVSGQASKPYLPETAVGDLFNESDLDVVINNIDSRPTLLKNVGGSNVGHWLTLRLIGDPAKRTPRDGVGSTMFCSAGGFRQRGEVASGRGYLSQSDQRIHFGLGTSNRIEKLEVLWSNGDRESLIPPTVDAFYVVEQGKGIRKPGPHSASNRVP